MSEPPDGLPRLAFRHGFDDRDEVETPLKGYRSDGVVIAPDGEQYAVTFYDPVRLGQDLEAEVELGATHLAEPGLVVVPEVTRESMEAVVAQLWESGYFARHRPLDAADRLDA